MTHTIYRIDCVSHLSNIMWLNSRLTYHISLLDHLENKKKTSINAGILDYFSYFCNVVWTAWLLADTTRQSHQFYEVISIYQRMRICYTLLFFLMFAVLPVHAQQDYQKLWADVYR